MEVIRFDHVTREFRQGGPKFIKEALLGSKGKRASSQTVVAVHDLSFSIHAGEAVALLGHNGSGKSTTLSLLARVLPPTHGRVTTHGRIAPLLELGSGFHPDLTGRENVFLNGAILGVPRRRIQQRMSDIEEFSGLGRQFDTPVRFYSTGMYSRLGFAIAVHVEPEIVLLDEVLAVGDREFQERGRARMSQMKSEGRTMVLVTHSLDEAASFCDRAIVLDHGRCTFDGNVSEAECAYAKSSRA